MIVETWMDDIIPMVDVPEGESEHFVVERFKVTKEEADLFNLGDTLRGGTGPIRPGTYTRLIAKNPFVDPIMSDTPSERRDHLAPVKEAHRGGEVLITGLGLGMVANAILRIPLVEKVIVLEISPEIIQLVGPHWQKKWGDRLEIIEQDAFTFKPPDGIKQRYSVVWHDIWDDIALDNLDGVQRLHRRFGRYADWQGSWRAEYLRAIRKRERSLSR